jgi:hypothetical protein
MRALILFGLAVLSGCNGPGTKTDCGDVSCLYVPTIKLHIADATSGAPAPLPEGWLIPVFTVGKDNLGTTCGESPDGGQWAHCTTWAFAFYGPGVIHITFPGYLPTDVPVNVKNASPGCCPSPLNPIETTVSLTKTS